MNRSISKKHNFWCNLKLGSQDMDKKRIEKLPRNKEYDQLIGPVRKLSKFIGIWPIEIGDVGNNVTRFHSAKKLQILHGVFIIVFITLLGAAQIADAIRHREKLEEFTKCCTAASSCILAVFRMLFYLGQRKKIVFLVETMNNDWLTMSEEDRTILRRKCKPAFVMSRWFIASISVTMTVFFIFPTVEMLFEGLDDYILPYGGYFGIADLKPPLYQILYVLEVLGGMYGICNVSSVNCFNVICIIHGAAKFLVLRKHISALKSDDDKSVEILRLYIQEHQRAIEFADILEEVINKVALGQFVISTGLVCFAGLQIAEMLGNTMHLIRYSVYLVSAIFELFLFSYSGYQLTLESELVGDAAFNSDWIGSSFTQNLNIVMMRATKPNKITAAKFYDMSLESFGAVLSTSFSYFTTLRAMNEE